MQWEFSETSKTISTAVSLSEYTNQLLSKVIRLEDKSTGSLIFWRNKESKSYFPVKKMDKKHSQVLLVFRKNPGKWNYGWSSVLKTYTAFIVCVFERMWCFDEVFLVVVTYTEQLFIQRPFYRHFLYNDHLPYLQ